MIAKKRKIRSVYIFPALFSIICLSYLIRFMFFSIETEIVKYDSIESSIKTKALIIRNESATLLPAGMEISYKVNEGEKVPIGRKILEIVKDKKTDDNIALKIKQLDERIKEIKQADINNDFFSQDKEKIESQINETVAELKRIAKSGDYENYDSVKENLAASLYKKSLIYGSGSFFGRNLEQLEKEKATLEGIYKSNIDVVYAQTTGVVSYNIDGYEQLLNPVKINEFKLANVKEIIDSIEGRKQGEEKSDSSGVKIVDNYEWYTCSLVSVEQAEGLKEGKAVKLRFSELGNVQVNGKIYKVSEPEGGVCLVIVRINEHVKDFYKLRLAEMDIIKEYNEGFIVPAEAIVIKDNIRGVYAVKNGVVKFIPVAVLAEDGEKVLVRNLSNEDSDFKPGYTALKVFDEVVTSTSRVKENQVLADKL